MKPKDNGNSQPIKQMLFLFLMLSLFSCSPKNIETQNIDSIIGKEVGSEELLSTGKSNAYYHFALSMLYKNRRHLSKALEELELAEAYDPNSAYIKHNLALFYLSLNRFNDSVTKLEEAVSVNPDYEPARALLGRIYASDKNPKKRKEGIRELEKSIELNPDDVEAHLYLANVHTEEKKFDMAEKNLMKVIELAPYDERGYYFLGRLNLLKGNLEESKNYYESALKRNPFYPLALVDLAGVYEKLGMLDESEVLYQNLVTFYPLSLESYIRYGNFLFTMNRLEDAAEQFRRAQRLDNQNPDIKLRLGLLYLEKKDYEKAIQEFNIILVGNPEDERAKYYLALCYTETGLYDDSLELLADIKEDSKFYDDTLVHRAYIFEKQGKLDEALGIVEMASERNPDNEVLVNYLGVLYRSLDRKNDAISLYNNYLSNHGGSDTIFYSLGVTYYMNGEEEKAIKTMRALLDENPDHADALNFIGYSYAEMGINLDEAESLVKRALELSPNRGYILDSLGWVYYKKGDLDKALEYLKKAVLLTSDDPTIMEHLGDVYRDKGDTLKALEFYEKGLELNADEDKEIKERLVEKITELKQRLNVEKSGRSI